MKIFEVGCIKTGTSSLGVAFKKLGLKAIGYNPSLFKLYQDSGIDAISSYIDEYDAFQDDPWHRIPIDELDTRYPNSKFILLFRDADKWFESCVNHWKRMDYLTDGLDPMYKHYINNVDTVREWEISQKVLKYSKVEEYFIDQPDRLLKMNICDDGDGWDVLCKFLDRPTPDIPFPKAFTLEKAWKLTMKKKRKKKLTRGLDV